MKNISISLFSILYVAMFISCEKHYSANNIEDIIKIRELIMDADCNKGIAFNGSYRDSYGDIPTSAIFYCDEWTIDANNIEDMGTIISAEYNRNKKIAKMEIKTTDPYNTYIKGTWTFYTRKKH